MIGRNLIHYTIEAKLGEGGMGVVYKATDTKLNRPVALKLLPSHVSEAEKDRERFIQEAKAAAALNHPNICTIYGIEEDQGRSFIVMEFVDGKMLEEVKGTLSLKQAIDIGIQIAEGLAVAHEKGIVHRDIKPENIMIRKDGIVQIMDFGLAKLRGVSRLTKEGSTVGTAGYMSPEQVQGHEVDHRSDIFSLGVLLFEMMTGQLPFKGMHETAMAYEIVNVDSPPPSSIKPEIPPELDAIVLECLEKDPKERTQSAGQVVVDLKRYRRESSRSRASRITAARPSVATRSQSTVAATEPAGPAAVSLLDAVRRNIPLLLIAATALVGGVVGTLTFLPGPPLQEAVWASIDMPRGTEYVSGVGGHSSISPDGSTIVFSGIDSLFQRLLWVRPLRSNIARPLAGTKDGEYPFWSHDGRTIGFFAEGKLRSVSAAGGPVLTITDAPLGRGASWSKNGTIVFSPSVADPNLYAVSSTGGATRAVTSFDTSSGMAPRFPFFLPDGEHFLFTSVTLGDRQSTSVTFVGSTDGATPQEISRGWTNSVYASGHLLYVRQGILMAQPFDPDARELKGDPVSLQEGVNVWLPRAKGDFSASENGILLSFLGGTSTREEFVWLNERGEQQTIVEANTWTGVALSPEERRIAFDEIEGQSQRTDIWIYDLNRSVKTKLTFSEHQSLRPLWAKDGSVVYYSGELGGSKALLFEKRADGSGKDVVLAEGDNTNSVIAPLDVSPDGRTLVVGIIYGSKGDLGVIDLQEAQRPARITLLGVQAERAKFSPDGRWLVYQSDISGKREVYVRSMTGDAGQYQISSGAGEEPLWSASGILYYSSTLDGYMKVPVTFSGGRPVFGQARPLLPPNTTRIRSIYAVTKDGKRFLGARALAGRGSNMLTAVVHWTQLLKK